MVWRVGTKKKLGFDLDLHLRPYPGDTHMDSETLLLPEERWRTDIHIYVGQKLTPTRRTATKRQTCVGFM